MLTAAARQCLAVLAWALGSWAPCFRETMKETEMFNSHSVEIDGGGDVACPAGLIAIAGAGSDRAGPTDGRHVEDTRVEGVGHGREHTQAGPQRERTRVDTHDASVLDGQA